MPELRYNIATGDWVIFATERAKRPNDFKKAKKQDSPAVEYKKDCPFCPGNEDKTPGEVFRSGDAKKWNVRCVPNLFGALSEKEKATRKGDNMFISMGGFGKHEVIIENPRHDTCIALMQDAEVVDILRAYKNRYVCACNTPGIETVVIFKNHGLAAGTSLEHPHSQLIATPIVPPHIRGRLSVAADYFNHSGHCVFCQTLEEELKAKVRVILESELFVSFLPFAGVSPFLIWILPKRHMSSFADINEAEITDLAVNLKGNLKKLYIGLDNPDFNFAIRSSPCRQDQKEHFHWYLNIVPRLTQPAGFELGTGMFINSSLPEQSAQFLRQVR